MVWRENLLNEGKLALLIVAVSYVNLVILFGRVAERFKATVLKTVVSKGTVGSNPTPSAFARHSSDRSDGGHSILYGNVLSKNSTGGLRRTQSASVIYTNQKQGGLSMYYVYILNCADSKQYTGCTLNLKERIERHQKGQVPATVKRLPVQLATYIAFKDKYTAFNFEKYLKSGSGRAFIKKHFN